MAKKLNIAYDPDLIEAISADFDLRKPNKDALRQLVFELEGDYDPEVMQVLNLATGVGKTYLMAAFIEYLRQQGVGNVVIVTPGKTVQAKTVQNFTPGNSRYIEGTQVPPEVVTPKDYSAWVSRINGSPRLAYGREVPLLAFIFNIQQLIAPPDIEGDTHGATQAAQQRRPRKFDESGGVLFEYLKALDDLVVIADESHLYSASAAAFSAALRELDPAATIGLTASADREDHVIYKYPLYSAIQDKYVKAPVLAFRKGGYGEDAASEEQQLRDALQLRQIKQAYYDAYAEQNGLRHLNAIAFIVCSDVDHATQVAELLRTPEYLGKGLAVLQVDSRHDDDKTQYLLENLDQPDSPVLAVVSVNKLKEGWDVKNIAVVVTLRAMASEVLTQQTMGRGLRLPFGKYTDVWQIDQLDIISHQSFQELLASENVLAQFGLEEAVKDGTPAVITGAVNQAVANMENSLEECANTQDSSRNEENNAIPEAAVSQTAGEVPNPLDETGTVGMRAIDENGFAGDQEVSLEFTTIERNPRFSEVEYKFPVTCMEIEQPKIDLSEIDDMSIEQAARKVTSTGDTLYRKEIIAALGKKLRAIDAESAEVESIRIDDGDAAEALAKLIMNMPYVPTTAETARYVQSYLVPRFMGSVAFEGWTIKSLESARVQLYQLVKDYVDRTLRATREIPNIRPKTMPGGGFTLPLGEKVYDPIYNASEFVRGRYYSGWFKSLFESESFDSYTGEYALARLLNTSPHIEWWHRLHTQDQAFIYYTSKDRYYPDFVARDTDGVFWIIEGKDVRGRDNERVQQKRRAAEALVRRMAAEEAYEGQRWGYLVAYEDDIASSDSWDDLKTLANPVTNVLGVTGGGGSAGGTQRVHYFICNLEEDWI